MSTWRLWSVEVYGFDAEIFTARSRDKARWRAYQAFRECRTCSFPDFLIESSIREVHRLPFDDDGYENVRAQYGFGPRIGEELELVGEGESSGRRVVVVYPGRHTASVHVAYPGEDEIFRVHPHNVRRVA